MQGKAGGKILNLILELNINGNGVVLSDSEILKFQYINKINTPPKGEMEIIDRGSQFEIPTSGTQGKIWFKNTSDTDVDKASIIYFTIDTIVKNPREGTNATYTITWTNGILKSLGKQTYAVKGNSIDAIMQSAEKYSYKFEDGITPKGGTKPTDVMVWRYIGNTMWMSLDETIQHSHIKDDYMFWYFDDVNSVYKISTLKLEDGNASKHVMVYNENASSGQDDAVMYKKDLGVTLWAYTNVTMSNTFGADRDKLFPMVVFSGITEGDINKAECSSECFSSVLKTSGDNSQEAISKHMGIEGPQKYGEVKHVRNYPNNTHKMYSLAPVFRDYKISSYGKCLTVVLKGTIGPSLGSKVSVLCLNNDAKQKGDTTFNKIYSDEYILVEKNMSYLTVKKTALGKEAGNGSADVHTVLRFVSNRLGDERFKDVYDFMNKITKDKKDV